MQVTGLKALGRRPGFVAVEVDGARFAVLPVEQVQALGLAPRRDLTEDDRRNLERAGALSEAHARALRLLAARGRSVREMVRRLRARGYPPDVVTDVVGRLEASGLLDDRSFAEAIARSRAERGYGPARIRADLTARGVERRVAERAVDAVVEGDEQTRLAAIDALVRKRAGQLRGVSPHACERRLRAYLARRGFTGADVLSVVRRVMRDAGRAR